jgi:hypothetical protein
MPAEYKYKSGEYVNEKGENSVSHYIPDELITPNMYGPVALVLLTIKIHKFQNYPL